MTEQNKSGDCKFDASTRDIHSPFNACMHREYCKSLERQPHDSGTSETPRTDAAVIQSDTDDRLAGELVSADFARGLERELAKWTSLGRSLYRDDVQREVMQVNERRGGPLEDCHGIVAGDDPVRVAAQAVLDAMHAKIAELEPPQKYVAPWRELTALARALDATDVPRSGGGEPMQPLCEICTPAGHCCSASTPCAHEKARVMQSLRGNTSKCRPGNGVCEECAKGNFERCLYRDQQSSRSGGVTESLFRTRLANQRLQYSGIAEDLERIAGRARRAIEDINGAFALAEKYERGEIDECGEPRMQPHTQRSGE